MRQLNRHGVISRTQQAISSTEYLIQLVLPEEKGLEEPRILFRRAVVDSIINRCHNAKIVSSASQYPEQIWMLGRGGSQESAVCEDKAYR